MARRAGWQKDLAAVIRQATNAALLSDATTKAQSDATTVVLVAAETELLAQIPARVATLID